MSFVGSLASLSASFAFELDVTSLVGGYVKTSQAMIRFIEFSGLFAGPIGMLGAVWCQASYTQIFMIYQVVRCCSWAAVFYFDGPALWHCETWITDIEGQATWNPRMYDVAMSGECVAKRNAFYFIGSIIFLISVYFTVVNYYFYTVVNDELPYIINRKSPSRMFAAHSLAEKAPLLFRHPYGAVQNQAPEIFPPQLPGQGQFYTPTPVPPGAMPPGSPVMSQRPFPPGSPLASGVRPASMGPMSGAPMPPQMRPGMSPYGAPMPPQMRPGMSPPPMFRRPAMGLVAGPGEPELGP